LWFSSHAAADLVIHLKDGRTLRVDVRKEDFMGMSFEAGSANASQPVTWDFETGNLKGWTRTGEAFNNQPTFGDNPTARNRGQASGHQGQYWIGTYENRPGPSDPAGGIQGDGPQGTLTSAPFTIRNSRISFLIGGGCDLTSQRVELLVQGEAVRKTTGECHETMKRISWDIGALMGKQAQIRIVDASSGGWGHINVDDFRFE
jgi:hypothetical protein